MMPINIMKIKTGSSENHKFHYNPRTLPKPPEELQRLVFPFIELCKISINALDASDTRPTYCAFPDFIERGRKVLLQDVAHIINIGRTHILFHHEAFKTELFLNYKENLSNFCSTSVNPVSQSLKAVLP